MWRERLRDFWEGDLWFVVLCGIAAYIVYWNTTLPTPRLGEPCGTGEVWQLTSGDGFRGLDFSCEPPPALQFPLRR